MTAVVAGLLSGLTVAAFSLAVCPPDDWARRLWARWFPRARPVDAELQRDARRVGRRRARFQVRAGSASRRHG